jgi:ribosomal protein L24E
MAVFVKLNMGKKNVEWTLSYKPLPTGSRSSHHIVNQDGKVVGFVRTKGSRYELTFKPHSLAWTSKKFKATSIKKAILDAVDFWNARKEHRVCTVCEKEFDHKLELYLGCPTCPEHSNGEWVMTL